MEVRINKPLDLGFCSQHEREICSVCVNSLCKKKLLCYQCVFFDHSKHVADCVPLDLWKAENCDETKIGEMTDKVERATSEIRDIGDLTHNYISSIVERLSELKKNVLQNKIDLPQILANLSLKKSYTVKDGFYYIKSDNIETMIDEISGVVGDEMEGFLIEKLSKIKTKNKNLGVTRKSLNRFSGINDNWSHNTSYWDGIGFKVSDSVVLLGVGIYKPEKLTDEFSAKIKIFEDDLLDTKVIYEKDYDLSKFNYEGELSDLTFDKEIILKRDVTYYIAKFNNKPNSNGKYGKTQATTSTEPFTFISIKGAKSDGYKSGNYSDLTCGSFPYFLYR